MAGKAEVGPIDTGSMRYYFLRKFLQPTSLVRSSLGGSFCPINKVFADVATAFISEPLYEELGKDYCEAKVMANEATMDANDKRRLSDPVQRLSQVSSDRPASGGGRKSVGSDPGQAARKSVISIKVTDVDQASSSMPVPGIAIDLKTLLGDVNAAATEPVSPTWSSERPSDEKVSRTKSEASDPPSPTRRARKDKFDSNEVKDGHVARATTLGKPAGPGAGAAGLLRATRSTRAFGKSVKKPKDGAARSSEDEAEDSGMKATPSKRRSPPIGGHHQAEEHGMRPTPSRRSPTHGRAIQASAVKDGHHHGDHHHKRRKSPEVGHHKSGHHKSSAEDHTKATAEDHEQKLSPRSQLEHRTSLVATVPDKTLNTEDEDGSKERGSAESSNSSPSPTPTSSTSPMAGLHAIKAGQKIVAKRKARPTRPTAAMGATSTLRSQVGTIEASG